MTPEKLQFFLLFSNSLSPPHLWGGFIKSDTYDSGINHHIQQLSKYSFNSKNLWLYDKMDQNDQWNQNKGKFAEIEIFVLTKG